MLFNDILEGDIWEIAASTSELYSTSIVVIPTNSILKVNGASVMGAGLAKQAIHKFPGLDLIIGSKIARSGNHVFFFKAWGIVSFPTKRDWREGSELSLIARSCEELNSIAIVHPDCAFYIPKVGTGKGRLNWVNVLQVVKDKLVASNIFLVEG
ncbi:hypothetical protein LCGC14_0381600 [marine sediment metagenome]|uniref:Macro domain-containing protein n=1 Tax=marine sediment metagenome TaxID=412755 RepID=A0A0F9WB02_9ZZZZ